MEDHFQAHIINNCEFLRAHFLSLVSRYFELTVGIYPTGVSPYSQSNSHHSTAWASISLPGFQPAILNPDRKLRSCRLSVRI